MRPVKLLIINDVINVTNVEDYKTHSVAPQIVQTWFSAVQFLPSVHCFPFPMLESFFRIAFSLTELFLFKIFNQHNYLITM